MVLRFAGYPGAAIGRNAAAPLASAASWAQEEPEDQTEQRQQQHQDYPERLLAVGRRALGDVDDRPDVADQDEQAQEAVVAGVEHGSSSSARQVSSISMPSSMRLSSSSGVT